MQVSPYTNYYAKISEIETVFNQACFNLGNCQLMEISFIFPSSEHAAAYRIILGFLQSGSMVVQHCIVDANYYFNMNSMSLYSEAHNLISGIMIQPPRSEYASNNKVYQ